MAPDANGIPPGGDDSSFLTPANTRAVASRFPKTPPPPPGVKVIEQWACLKLAGDIARLKKRVIKEAMRELSLIHI